MAKKIKLYERILLGLAFSADKLIELYYGGTKNYRKRYFYDPWLADDYKPSNLYQSYHRLLKTGFIEKVIKDGQPYLRLTSKAQEKLERDFPILNMQRQKWDGRWRLVIFDISEQARYIRDSLREKLKELGFGQLQQSIYISPFDFVKDVDEFLEAHDLKGKAFILTAKHELMGDPRDLAQLVWKLDKLGEDYENLWVRMETLKDAKDKEKEIQAIKNKYLEVIKTDPCLPKDLLPFEWRGEEVRKTIGKL